MRSVVLPPSQPASVGSASNLGPSSLDRDHSRENSRHSRESASLYQPPSPSPVSMINAAVGAAAASAASRASSLFSHGGTKPPKEPASIGITPEPAHAIKRVQSLASTDELPSAVPGADPTLLKASSTEASIHADSSQLLKASSTEASIHADSSQPPVTKFLLFDFTMVSGLDATAARSCFLNLCRTLTPLGITLVFGGVESGGRVERLLIGHEILQAPLPNPVALRFDSIDEALEYCEEALLATAAGSADSSGAGASAGAEMGYGRSDGLRSPLSRVLSPLVEAEW